MCESRPGWAGSIEINCHETAINSNAELWLSFGSPCVRVEKCLLHVVQFLFPVMLCS